MYKFLKNYKNLENHLIRGQLVTLKRLETRCVLIKYYPSTFDFLMNVEDILKVNYFPLYQQYFDLKYFISQNVISKTKKIVDNNFHIRLSEIDLTEKNLTKEQLLQPFRYLIQKRICLKFKDANFRLKNNF